MMRPAVAKYSEEVGTRRFPSPEHAGKLERFDSALLLPESGVKPRRALLRGDDH
jgi:hypothetical protein